MGASRSSCPASARCSAHAATNGLVTEYGWTSVSSDQGRTRSWSAYPPHKSMTGWPPSQTASAAPVPGWAAITPANCSWTASKRGSTRPYTCASILSTSGTSRSDARSAGGSAGGEREGQLGAPAGLAAGGQLTTVGPGPVGRAGQPDAAARDLFGPVAPPEPVEDVRQVLGRDADAGVADGQDGSGAVAAGANGDLAALGGELQRVGQQVGDHLVQPAPVGPHRHRGQVPVQGQAGRLEPAGPAG